MLKGRYAYTMSYLNSHNVRLREIVYAKSVKSAKEILQAARNVQKGSIKLISKRKVLGT